MTYHAYRLLALVALAALAGVALALLVTLAPGGVALGAVFALPREANLARVRSVFARSLRKAREACRAYRRNPNPGTLARRWERVLGCIAQSRRVAFVRVVLRPDLRGAARTGAVRKAARLYREASLRWARRYDEESGWGAHRRLASRGF